MSLLESEAFAFESLLNSQAVDSNYISLNGVSGVLKGVNNHIQGSSTTDDLPEGKTNLYFTDGRAQGAFTAGTGIAIANTAGVFPSLPTGTISNTGVLSLTGTNNRISVSGSTGNITLNLPQDINTTSSPQFTGLTLGTLSGVLKASAGVIANGATTDDLTEGKTNLYFTDARAQGAFSAGTNIALSSGVISTVSNPTFNTLNITSMNSNISNGLSLGTSAGIAGSYNVYLGHQAGTSATGSSNVGIGYQALAGATGNNSFGLGFTAGYNMQTSGNVCIGNSTGQNL